MKTSAPKRGSARISKIFLATFALTFMVTTCSHPPVSPDKNLNLASLSADQVVQDYYKYIAAHDIQSASQFLAPDVVNFYRSVPDSDFNNVKNISNVTVSKVYNSTLDNKYKYEVQVDANYVAQYKQVITDPSGPQTRFIYLGRNSQSDPWEIISIGTGP